MNIIMPKSWSVFEAVTCFRYPNNDWRYVEAFQPAFRPGHIDTIVINVRMETISEHIQKINVPVMFSDRRDEIAESGRLYDRGISFSEVRLFVANNY